MEIDLSINLPNESVLDYYKRCRMVLEDKNKKLEIAAKLVINTIKAHEVTCFSCDRDGEQYCNCIKENIEELEKVLNENN